MPTENRSSTIDPRDLFISLNPLGLGEAELRKDSTGFEDQRTHSDYLLFLAGYRESHPEPLQHTEQHQGEPVAGIDAEPFFGLLEALRGQIGYAIQFPVNCDAFKDGISKVWATIELLEKCIAIAAKQIHADPGEVERLQEELSMLRDEDLKWRGLREQEAEIGALRAQLAERDELLHELADAPPAAMEFRLQQKVKAALSASAEPSAPGVLSRAHDVNMFQRAAEPGAKS